jgi:glutamate racemase
MRPMLDSRPVGVFDSGLGGLSIVREMRRSMPRDAFVYVSDARHLPYGEKSEAFIRGRCIAIADFLLATGVRGLVVACNSATAAAVAELRARLSIPVIGIEPAVKPAAAATQSGIVGILATASTLQSRKYAELLERFGSFTRVIGQPCPGLVERVEAGDLDGPQTLALLRRCIEPLLAAGADTLVLGCTHYPFLAASIQRVAGAKVHIVDPSVAVARRARELLGDVEGGAATLRCFTSGDVALQSRVASRLLGETIVMEPLLESVSVASP